MESNAIPLDDNHNLVAAERVIGTSVFNGDGDAIGAIKTLMLNKLNGRVAFAVLEAGGFLGIGADYYPIPWDALRYDTELGGFRVDQTDFTDAPRYPSDSEPNWLDRLFADDVRRYYGRPGPAVA